MMGLERLLSNLYGSTPQIDMDLQVARARMGRPQILDIAALADGCKRNNVGVSMIVVEALAEVEGETVRRCPKTTSSIPAGEDFVVPLGKNPGRA
jgi:hypothetical protein